MHEVAVVCYRNVCPITQTILTMSTKGKKEGNRAAALCWSSCCLVLLETQSSSGLITEERLGI